MKIVVFGAGGRTGALVIQRAVAAGHTVSAFVHDKSHQPAGARILVGDTGNPVQVREAIHGQDAVIDTVGGKSPYKATDLETSAARNIVEAMKAEGVQRLLMVSMMGVGDSAEQAPFWYEHLLLPTWLHGATPDKTHMEETVQASGIEYTIVRPPVLSDDPATGSYHVVPKAEKAHKITRADLAQFLVDQLTRDQYVGQAVVVANS